MLSMVNGYSLRKSAKVVEINIATSFFWRHKILDCISTFLGKGYVDGIIEADEVFFAESFKGTKPSSEACGIIFLKENEIKRICSEKLRLMDFLDSGGKLIQQKEFDYDMEMYAGVHLTFLNRLMEDKNNLVNRFINGNLN